MREAPTHAGPSQSEFTSMVSHKSREAGENHDCIADAYVLHANHNTTTLLGRALDPWTHMITRVPGNGAGVTMFTGAEVGAPTGQKGTCAWWTIICWGIVRRAQGYG